MSEEIGEYAATKGTARRDGGQGVGSRKVKRKPTAQWRVLDQAAHAKGNRAEYEGNMEVDVTLLDAMIRIARELERRVRALGPVRGD